MRALKARIVFVSGLSGSGKSTAMAALEDLSFYCVDNLPVQLIEQFLGLCTKATPPIEKIALAIDAREAHFLRELPGVVASLRARGARVEVVFLEASSEALVNRYRETRRVHPLSPEGSVERGIEIERALLVDVAELAECRNVHAKLGGLVMPINGFGFHKRDKPASSDEIVEVAGDYYRHAIECFGPDRCMFESNFPVDKQSCSYPVLWNAFKKLAAGYSAAEKAQLFHDTAARAYRLTA